METTSRPPTSATNPPHQAVESGEYLTGAWAWLLQRLGLISLLRRAVPEPAPAAPVLLPTRARPGSPSARLLHDDPRAGGAWPLRAMVLIVGLALARLAVAAMIPIADGEAYYYSWSRFPSWSYYDHPPLVAWLTWLATRLGDYPAAVRLLPLVCSLLFNLLLYRLTATQFSARAGFLAVALVNLLPAFAVTGFVLNPEAPLAPLWVLYLLLVDRMRRRDEAYLPLVAGAVMGLGFLAKYTAVLLAPLTLLLVAVSPASRRWLRRPSLYAGGLVALLFASPVLAWNVVRGFPTLALHFVERRAPLDGLTTLANLGGVLLGQLGAFHPLALPGLLVALVFALRRGRTDERYRFLASASWPVLLFFLVTMARVRDAEFHWTMVGFVPLVVAAAGLIDEGAARIGPGLRLYLGACLALSALGFGLVILHVMSPVVVEHLPPRLYDPRHDVANETVGWQAVRAEVAKSQARLGPGTVAASCQYALCAHLLAEVDDRPPVFCPSVTRTAFDFFGRRDPPAAAPVVYVVNDHYGDPPSLTMPGRQCGEPRVVPISRGGTRVRDYRIWECAPLPLAAPAPSAR